MAFWIQTLKKGTLKRQLKIPEKNRIPKKLLIKIKQAKLRSRIKNPVKKGKRIIKVTPLLKKRAVVALTLAQIHRRKKKKRFGKK